MIWLVAAAMAADSVPDVDVDAQLWRLPVDARRTLWADDASLTPGFGARLGVGYTKAPLVWRWEDTGEEVAIVDDALGLDVIASYALWRVRLGADLPVYALASGDSASGAGLGDFAIDAKGTLLDPDTAPLGLALDARVRVPTATTSVPLGSPGVAWEVAAVADENLGPVLLALNVGIRGQPTDETTAALTDQLSVRLGGGWAITDGAGVSLDLAGEMSLQDPSSAAGGPVELMLGGYYHPVAPLGLRLGVGRGLNDGIGASGGRVVFAVGWEPQPKAKELQPKPVVATTPPSTAPPTTAAPTTTVSTPAAATTSPTAVAKTEPAPATTPTVTITQTTPPPVAAPTAPVFVVPQAAPTVTAIQGNKFTLSHKIEFDGETLLPSSKPTLDEVVRLLEAHPELTAVRIESHTDAHLNIEDSLVLSGTRATAVMSYLINAGISADRLIAAGYGSTKPVVPGTSAAAWAENDRIEFVITGR